ncbi:putative aliphatic sulfonates-binding protein [compost metagenome]
MGLPEAVIERTFSHRPASPPLPMSDEIIAAQQRTADLFLENRLLPRRVDIASAVWRP